MVLLQNSFVYSLVEGIQNGVVTEQFCLRMSNYRMFYDENNVSRIKVLNSGGKKFIRAYRHEWLLCAKLLQLEH